MSILKDFSKRAQTDKLDPWFGEFVRHYIAAMLWSSTDDSDDQGGEPLDNIYSGYPGEFGEGVYENIVAECTYFFKENEDLIESGQGSSDKLIQQAAHYFWLDRNGHGVGFRDGDKFWSEDVCNKLSKSADKYGEQYCEVGDDGKLYLSPMQTYNMPWKQPPAPVPQQPPSDDQDIVVS